MGKARRFQTIAAAALAFGAGAPALAHDYKLGAITIEHPWARATLVKVGGA